ncbi:K02A2.6-like [Cordylochernes scorpioides]|uniref:K02A2.6-like n=1 Tax=Cordylochernes scorpioides TaxID=51811 RepID=A0ABY6K9E0_9ARAC|nr:K02A2.6-like [Cordylochernes scorpioides]
MPGHRKRRQFKQTDAFTRGMVIGLKRAGWSIRQIAADTHLGASTVHRLWRRWLKQGNVAIYRNAGATRVTSARVDRRILRQAVAAPQATCTAFLQHVQDTLDHSISTRTISRRLVANGLHSCRPLRRLPLTPPNRHQRLEWCRARSTWMTEWHRVVFSDESRFCLSSDSRRVRLWRRRGERSNPGAIVERPTVRQRGIVVWGAFAYDSRSPLLRIQGTMTAQRYVDDVLRQVTLPYLQGVPNALYQQDNARPHTARISQQALQDVQMLPWPPYSPGLSPIEHVWDIIGRRLHALPQPRSEDELWQMVEREWRAIPQDAIPTLIDSLPRRVAACIAVRANKAIELDRYPIPSIDEIFSKLFTSLVLSTLDLSQAYLQVMLAEEAKAVVDINTTKRLFSYKRLPYDVAVAPNKFQRIMEGLFYDLPGVACYIDDILVAGKDFEDHEQKIKRWSLKLAAFNYTVEFLKTIDNSNVDALSRLPLESSVRESLDEDQVLLLRKSNEVPFSFMEVANETPQDKILSIVLRNVREGNWKFTRVPRENPLAPHYKINEELSLEFGCLQWRGRVVIPQKLRSLILNDLHEIHMGIVKMEMIARRAFPQTVIKEFPGGTANEEKFKIKILEFNTKMGNPREVFHEAVRRQEQFTTGCEVYFRNYATGPKRGSFREVWIDKFQGRGVADRGSPAGAAVGKGSAESSWRRRGEGISRVSWPACQGLVCAEKTWQSGGRSLSGDNGTCSREKSGDDRRGKLAPGLCVLTSGGRGETYLGRH